MKRRKAFQREHRLIQIVNKMTVENDGINNGATAAEVGKWLDVSGVQARTLLRHLVAQGVLEVTSEPYPGICRKREIYRFAFEYLEGTRLKKLAAVPKPKRTIKINGQQMSMEVQ